MSAFKRILAIVLSVIAVLAILWSIQYKFKSKPGQIKTYSVTNPLITPDEVQIAAHRSGAGIMPEETMMAFKNCVESGDFSVDWIEFDLHITKDNELVLLHDDELDRTSDSEAVFGEKDVEVYTKTLAELKTLNMGARFQADDGSYPYADASDEELEDLRIVTLDEALDYLTANGDYNYIIEIKNEGELGKKAADILYQDLVDRGILEKVVTGAFHDDVNTYIDENYPDFARCASPSEVIEFILAGLLNKKNYSPKFEVINMPYGDITENYGINTGTARFVNYAHAHDVAVFYWTINKTKQMEYLTSIGADCLITDYPDLAEAYRVPRSYGK